MLSKQTPHDLPTSYRSRRCSAFILLAARLFQYNMHQKQQNSSQFNYLIYLNSLKSSLKILGCDRLRFNAYPFSFHELYQFQSVPTEKALALYQHRMETACLYKPTVLHRSSQYLSRNWWHISHCPCRTL